jgi:UDP-N-acetylmuramate dehydrogenase
MELLEKINLKPFNTFGISVTAKYFCEVENINQLQELRESEMFKKNPSLILGGGSNILFTKNFEGIIIRNSLKGIEKVKESDDSIELKVSSGEIWSDLVMHCVKNNWGGIENLSLIPGTVGAAPIQNIGAYGVEVSDVIKNVEAIDLTSGRAEVIDHDDCKFSYRESVFKSGNKKKFFISSVTLRLTKKNHHINTRYGAVLSTLQQKNNSSSTEFSIQQISDAVIQIRKEKLPDYRIVGNAGSFFKNPEIDQDDFKKLKNDYPEMPHYNTVNQQVKIPAGWLIEQCGWKGKTFDHVGVHPHQALVIINREGASGDEIFSLALKIISSVREKFSITLTPEVNIF